MKLHGNLLNSGGFVVFLGELRFHWLLGKILLDFLGFLGGKFESWF